MLTAQEDAKVEKLTREQCAIISAYTGYLLGSFQAFHEYSERILGRPIWTHQFPSLAESLKEASREDFIALSYEGK